MTNKTSVNLSAAFGLARNQGRRRTCVAFALSDLNRFHHDCTEALSAEHLYLSAAYHDASWKPHWGMRVSTGLDILRSTGQPTEKAVPYASGEPAVKPVVPPPAIPPLYQQDLQPRPRGSAVIVASLMAGIPIGVLLLLTAGFFMPIDGKVVDSPTAIKDSEHAVIACGLVVDLANGDTLIQLRNSWGPDWGHDGHAWVTSNYLDLHSISTYRIS